MLGQLFVLIDRCIDAYESSAQASTYARMCGLTLVKAKNLAIGAYSLILDGLGQEAGALIRPFIEYIELLTYFRRFPDKAEAAARGDALPSAGDRAKAISGIYGEFREHLNRHASHSSYSSYSLSHLLDGEDRRLRKLQRMVPKVLERNVRDLCVQVYLLLHEAILGLEFVSRPDFVALAGSGDELHRRLVGMLKD